MPLSRYRLTPDAQSDLIEIRDYTTREWGGTQSQKYLSELKSAMNLIAEMPSLGKRRADVGINVFSFPHASHVIYYVENEHQIIVFGVLHKKMIPIKHLIERDSG